MSQPAQEPIKGSAPVKPLTMAATIAALGVVFGDIGTSPLYAFKECLRVKDGDSNILGTSQVVPILSLIIWSLIFVVMVKYVLLVMEANEDGEGGIMTLVSLASAKDKEKTQRKHRSFLVLLGVFGAALLYGDGVITPAISVVSALEGVKEANERLHGPLSAGFLKYFIPTAAVLILVGIFWLQKIGTGRVGMYFGPITMVWFIVIGGLGILSLVLNHAVLGQIMWAFNPLEGLHLLITHPGLGILILGAVFLSVTGAEALYADMGHFGQKPIRAAWCFIVFPALILNYLGQGAWALAHPAELLVPGFNPFFNMAPNWAQIPLVIIATLAAIIASQALIAGAFSITMQAIQLNYLPRMRIERTSDQESGQVYVPRHTHHCLHLVKRN
jgi:KUP system potassium uptake protein